MVVRFQSNAALAVNRYEISMQVRENKAFGKMIQVPQVSDGYFLMDIFIQVSV